LHDLSQEAKDLVEAGSRKRLADALDEISDTIRKRRKVLKLADRSPAGWDTVQEYLTDDLASDSDDGKKMRQAENRAISKKAKDAKKSSSFSPAIKFSNNRFPAPAMPLASQHLGYQGISFQQPRLQHAQVFQQVPRVIPAANVRMINPVPNIQGAMSIRPRQPGCFICGALDHWKHSCPSRTN
uniref:CCHC-type domain-containing protein n=2 Tax=Clytia hemisphaerica TaxID=252671 RepID=A0A7M5WQ27_9CNID